MVWPVLVDFTRHRRDRYPALSAWPTTRSMHQFFDGNTLDWAEGKFELPLHSRRPLLLVPREFVSKRLLMNPSQFYRREAIEAVWQQRSSPRPLPRLLRRDLHREFPRVRSTNLEQALVAREHGRDLLKDYEDDVDRRFTALTTALIAELVLMA